MHPFEQAQRVLFAIVVVWGVILALKTAIAAAHILKEW